MTPEEKENPKLINYSRARRVARGSGTTEKDVKELLKQYVMMRRMLKMMKRKKGKMPFMPEWVDKGSQPISSRISLWTF